MVYYPSSVVFQGSAISFLKITGFPTMRHIPVVFVGLLSIAMLQASRCSLSAGGRCLQLCRHYVYFFQVAGWRWVKSHQMSQRSKEDFAEQSDDEDSRSRTRSGAQARRESPDADMDGDETRSTK